MKKRLAGLYKSQHLARGADGHGSSSMAVSPAHLRITDATSAHAIDMALNSYLNETGAADYDLP